jgi:hypothetical protein
LELQTILDRCLLEGLQDLKDHQDQVLISSVIRVLQVRVLISSVIRVLQDQEIKVHLDQVILQCLR